MASHDPEFYEAPKFSPEYGEPPRRERGCFFYGCVFTAVLAVLLIIALAAVTYIGVRIASRFLDEWTSTAPMELPKVQISEEQSKSVRERFDAFQKSLEEGKAVEPLVLTGDDLNALFEGNADLRGMFHFNVDGDKLKAQISIPLDKMNLAPVRGRYLNGEAELKASLNNGVLIVTLDSLRVNGKQPPDAFLTQLRQQNIAKDLYKNPKHAEMISRFESLQIKDGKIILKPRPRPGSPADRKDSRPPEKPFSPTSHDAPPAESPKPGPAPSERTTKIPTH
jgi:hypothetical protein